MVVSKGVLDPWISEIAIRSQNPWIMDRGSTSMDYGSVSRSCTTWRQQEEVFARPEARMLPWAAPRPGPGAYHPRSSLRCPLPENPALEKLCNMVAAGGGACSPRGACCPGLPRGLVRVSTRSSLRYPLPEHPPLEKLCKMGAAGGGACSTRGAHADTAAPRHVSQLQ
jgi:hypothetical protein